MYRGQFGEFTYWCKGVKGQYSLLKSQDLEWIRSGTPASVQNGCHHYFLEVTLSFDSYSYTLIKQIQNMVFWQAWSCLGLCYGLYPHTSSESSAGIVDTVENNNVEMFFFFH